MSCYSINCPRAKDGQQIDYACLYTRPLHCILADQHPLETEGKDYFQTPFVFEVSHNLGLPSFPYSQRIGMFEFNGM